MSYFIVVTESRNDILPLLNFSLRQRLSRDGLSPVGFEDHFEREVEEIYELARSGEQPVDETGKIAFYVSNYEDLETILDARKFVEDFLSWSEREVEQDIEICASHSAHTSAPVVTSKEEDSPTTPCREGVSNSLLVAREINLSQLPEFNLHAYKSPSSPNKVLFPFADNDLDPAIALERFKAIIIKTFSFVTGQIFARRTGIQTINGRTVLSGHFFELPFTENLQELYQELLSNDLVPPLHSLPTPTTTPA